MQPEIDENKLIADSARAARAQALLDDDMLKEAFAKLEGEYYAAWRSTGAAEAETYKRERLWQAINLLGKVKDHLKYVVENGKVAKAHLAQIAGRRK